MTPPPLRRASKMWLVLVALAAGGALLTILPWLYLMFAFVLHDATKSVSESGRFRTVPASTQPIPRIHTPVGGFRPPPVTMPAQPSPR